MDPGYRFEARLRRDLVEQVLARPGDRVVVGVSGGSDSMALLAALRAIGLRHGFAVELFVAHLNHGLRGAASDGDAAFVEARAREWGLSMFVERSAAHGASASNLEERAREERARFFSRVVEATDAHAVAVGHTMDDQAETVIHRLARGGGVRSLAAMEARRPDGLIRPLLGRRREDCVRYLADVGVPFVEDESNRDPAFTRNRIRSEVLPHLSQQLGVDISQRLAHLAADLRVEATLADQRIAEILAEQPSGGLGVDAVRAAGDAAGRLVHAWLAAQGHVGTRAQVEGLVAIAWGPSPSAGIDIRGARAERSYDLLRCRPSGGDAPAGLDPRDWLAPGAVELDSGWRLSAVAAIEATAAEGSAAAEVVVDAERVQGALTVRTPLPGDKIRLRAGRRKLSDLFIDTKIPRFERRRLAVVTRGADIVWVPGVAVAANVLPGDETERWMRLRAERVDCRHFGSVVENQVVRVRFG